jgi:hypothetical protein
MSEQLYFAAGIARRDDGVPVGDEIMECADAEAAVIAAERMWQGHGYIAAVAFTRSLHFDGRSDGAVLQWFGGPMPVTITLDSWIE